MRNTFVTCSLVSLTLACTSQLALAANPNPNFNYIINGEIIPGWSMQLGDPDNWSTPVANRFGKSASGKVSVEPSDFQAKGDAIKLTWSPRKDVPGNAAIYGSPIDLSSFENQGALVIDVKVLVKPDNDVTIGMDCGYPCGGKLHIKPNLSNLKKDQWSSLPIPLNCFTKEGMDLKKVNGPLVMSTNGKLTLEITNVRLQKLEEGDKGCAK